MIPATKDRRYWERVRRRWIVVMGVGFGLVQYVGVDGAGWHHFSAKHFLIAFGSSFLTAWAVSYLYVKFMGTVFGEIFGRSGGK